jgi:hypothetical protein
MRLLLLLLLLRCGDDGFEYDGEEADARGRLAFPSPTLLRLRLLLDALFLGIFGV